MFRGATWWKKLGGLLAACVLAVLVAAPVGSALCVCGDGGGATSSEVSASGVRAAQADHQQTGSPCKAPCCQGGHCHHGSMIGATLVAVAEPAPLAAEHATAPSPVLASRSGAALDRPPRA